MNLWEERVNGDFVRSLIRSRQVSAVHDLSDGGLVVGAAEMALASNVGVELAATSRAHAHPFLFGEDQGRYLLATRAPEAVEAAALQAGVKVAIAGRAGGDAFAAPGLFSIPLSLHWSRAGG